jgi:amino acid transporter, AAT family
VRTPGFPVVQLVGLGLLIAILVTMGLDKEIWYISWVVGVPWLLLLSAGYFIMRARIARAAAAAVS